MLVLGVLFAAFALLSVGLSFTRLDDPPSMIVLISIGIVLGIASFLIIFR